MHTSLALTSRGTALAMSNDSFGGLRRSDDALADELTLRQRLEEDGYLYIPGFFESDAIMEVRRELCAQLERTGKLDPDFPAIDAVPCPPDKTPAYPAGAQNFPIDRRHPTLERFLFGPRIMDFYGRFLGGAPRHYDHTWIRAVSPGMGTPPHCDLVYMGRGTHNVCTAWIPYGDTPLDLGGLMMLEGSHKQSERLANYLAKDVDTYCANRSENTKKAGWLAKDPAMLREKLGGRWLTTEFKAGDLLTFGMKMVHASLDNQSDRIRLSTDTRYQLANEEIDNRWIGPDTEEWAAKNRVGLIC